MYLPRQYDIDVPLWVFSIIKRSGFMIELWKDIKGWENYYQVSNMGRIKSLSRFNSQRERILKQNHRRGYHSVLFSKSNIHYTVATHRLVAIAFIPNPFNKPQINHINGIRDDNQISNLEWCDQSYNIKHAYENGRGHIKQVLMLCLNDKPLLIFNSQTEASKMTGIDSRRISDCCNGRKKQGGNYKWKHYPNLTKKMMKKKEEII